MHKDKIHGYTWCKRIHKNITLQMQYTLKRKPTEFSTVQYITPPDVKVYIGCSLNLWQVA